MIDFKEPPKNHNVQPTTESTFGVCYADSLAKLQQCQAIKPTRIFGLYLFKASKDSSRIGRGRKKKIFLFP